MAESHGGFEAIATIPTESVLEALRRTMVLGLPVDDAHKPTFYFDLEQSFDFTDREGSPFDWTAVPTEESQKQPVKPVCAFEFFSPLGRQGGFVTEVGDFNPTTVIFTMFQEEFDSVKGFSYATVGPSDQKWYFRFFRPAYGLGDQSVYQIHCAAEGVE